MKKCIVTICGIITISFGFSQKNIQGKAIYEIQSAKSKTVLEMHFSPQTYIYRYVTNTDNLSFKKTFGAADSLKESEARTAIQQELAHAPIQEWYGNLNTNVVTYSTFDARFRTYCVRDTLSLLKWELHPDTARINGLLCQKAIGKLANSEYVAWYAPSIPVSVAPLVFRGLPGLLVKAYNTATRRTVTMTYLEWPAKQAVEIVACSAGPYVTKGEFETIQSQLQKEARNTLELLKDPAYRKQRGN